MKNKQTSLIKRLFKVEASDNSEHESTSESAAASRHVDCASCCQRETKIIFMLVLVLLWVVTVLLCSTVYFSYFFVEMFVGFMYNSLALVADACHMLSDGLCLVIALIAIQGEYSTVLTLLTVGFSFKKK